MSDYRWWCDDCLKVCLETGNAIPVPCKHKPETVMSPPKECIPLKSDTYRQDAHVNTTAESGQLLSELEHKARHQEKLVMDHFHKSKPKAMTPSTVHQEMRHAGLISSDVPITSIRRAMSILTERGLLRKSEKELGPLGRPEHTWELNK